MLQQVLLSAMWVGMKVGGYLQWCLKYRMMKNIVHHCLVATSLLAMWHLNSLLDRSVVRGR